MKLSTLFAAALLLGAVACNRDKDEIGDEGMNAAATEAADATASPVVDNPNVVSENEAPNPNAPVMTFEETEFDFGDIQPDTKVKHTFTFTNTGKSPLLIQDATATCGCTTPNWTKQPVAPGDKGTVDVQFDSRGKQGLQNKKITVRANTQPSTTSVFIKGNILATPSNGPERPI